jgi:hypothetical protein
MAELPGAPTPLTIHEWTLDELNALVKRENEKAEAVKKAQRGG